MASSNSLAVLNFERGQMKDAEIYLLRYMRLATPNLESLIMGVKIARGLNDSGAEQSYLQQLRRRFPDAPRFSPTAISPHTLTLPIQPPHRQPRAGRPY